MLRVEGNRPTMSTNPILSSLSALSLSYCRHRCCDREWRRRRRQLFDPVLMHDKETGRHCQPISCHRRHSLCQSLPHRRPCLRWDSLLLVCSLRKQVDKVNQSHIIVVPSSSLWSSFLGTQSTETGRQSQPILYYRRPRHHCLSSWVKGLKLSYHTHILRTFLFPHILVNRTDHFNYEFYYYIKQEHCNTILNTTPHYNTIK